MSACEAKQRAIDELILQRKVAVYAAATVRTRTYFNVVQHLAVSSAALNPAPGTA